MDKTQKPRLNPDCPCENRDCPRNRDCEACREYHHGLGQKTTCERQQAAKAQH